MAGITATISIESFAADWATHMPIADLCARWTVTKDQVLRLRDVWNLPLRNDRRLRFKPALGESRDPTPSEIRKACLEIQSRWDDRTRGERQVTKPRQFVLKRIELTNDAREAMEGFADE
jgi:hypothetical protein